MTRETAELRLVVANTWRACTRCNVPKSDDDFYPMRAGRRMYCKRCELDTAKERRSATLDVEGSDGGMTYNQIGEVMGITGERVRQIEVVALRKLKGNARVMATVRKMLEGR